MKFTRVINVRWANSEHTIIDCEVDFDDVSEEFVPFSANLDDEYPHSKELFNQAALGVFGEIAEYVPPPPLEVAPIPSTSLTQASIPQTLTRQELSEKIARLEALVNQLTMTGV